MEFHCSQTIVFAVHNDIMSLLNSVGGVRVVWMRGFVGGVCQTLASVVWVTWVHKILAPGQKNSRSRNFGVGETRFYELYYYDSMKFSL